MFGTVLANTIISTYNLNMMGIGSSCIHVFMEVLVWYKCMEKNLVHMTTIKQVKKIVVAQEDGGTT